MSVQDPIADQPTSRESSPLSSYLGVGAIASGAAGVINAVSAGVHSETAALSRVFVVIAVLQIGAAAAVMFRPTKHVGRALLGVNAAAAVGWLAALMFDISWINGLQVAHAVHFTEAAAAALAVAAVVTAALASRGTAPSAPRVRMMVPALMAAALAIPAMVSASDHVATNVDVQSAEAPHEHPDAEAVAAVASAAEAPQEHDGDGDHAATDDDSMTDHDTDDAHDMAGDEMAGDEMADDEMAGDEMAGDMADHDMTSDEDAGDTAGDMGDAEMADGGHVMQSTPPVPYDPTMPIDLGGVEGVTPQQQAFAENLVAATIRDLPQWADLDAVEAAGFRSIGDGGTGHEHYIQWDWIDDDIILDPDFPESLVFEPQPDGTKKLVSAMFMLPSSIPIEEAPHPGGSLMQWHVHGDLCFTDDPEAPRVAGLKPVGTPCRAPLVDGTLAPMVHVWIRPHECGPFAALDGIGAGQVAAGESEWCDVAHGSN